MSVVSDGDSSDTSRHRKCSSQDVRVKTLSSIKSRQNPIDFLRVLYEGAVAGATAGVVVEAALYPIDTIKTRLQAGSSWWRRNSFEEALLWFNWKSCWGLTERVRKYNLTCYEAGQCVFLCSASAIFVGVYEPTKQKLLKSLPENLSAFAHFTAGALAGAASSIVRVPTEVVKQRMQTGQFSSAPGAVSVIVAKEGFRGLFAGYGSFLLRDLPFDALQFCIYEQLRLGYKLAARRDLNDPENAMIGAFAGAITGALTTPLDVIKTRLMIQGTKKQYNNVFHCVQTIVREEGPSTFFKGIGPRVLWIGIGGSIFFGVLERTKLLLSQRHRDPLLEQRSR